MDTTKVCSHRGRALRKLWQQDWFGIRFSDIEPTSSRKLAESVFYEKFYNCFFARYGSWSDLPRAWRAHKREVADKLLGLVNGGDKSVLSVGCGIGYIERCLLASGISADRLHITEIVEPPLRWIARELPRRQIHVGPIPECLPSGAKWDTVYLSSVEYALDDASLCRLLFRLRSKLREGGQLILISSTFIDSPSLLETSINAAKEWIKHGLDWVRLRDRGQFWGWARTIDELEDLFRVAGYSRITSGYVEPSRVSYCVQGQAGVNHLPPEPMRYHDRSE